MGRVDNNSGICETSYCPIPKNTSIQTQKSSSENTRNKASSPSVVSAINAAFSSSKLRNVFDVRQMWNEVSASMSGSSSPADPPVMKRFMLWIDGVGAYLVCLNDKTTLGGPASQEAASDISLMAQIGRHHVTFVRVNEGYVLQAHAPSKVRGRDVIDETLLSDGAQIELGNGVCLEFRQPSVLSSTAIINFVSDHRPSFSVDGIILMDETCILGPGGDCHIRCSDWSQSVVLVRRGEQLTCQSRTPLMADNKLIDKTTHLSSGSVVSGSDCQFRIESV